jgi:alpha-ribazole phosphatase
MTADSVAPTEVYLIRHGETADEFRSRCYGSLDVPLAPTGVRQVEAAALGIPACTLSAIYCSPRTRCVHSAHIIARHQSCSVTAVEELAELDFGRFEGQSYSEIALTHPELYSMWMQHPTEVQFPSGESFEQMRQRVLRAVLTLRDRHNGRSFAIVTHGGVNRIVLANALGLASENIFRLAQRYAAINLVRYYGEHPVVELINGRDCK